MSKGGTKGSPESMRWKVGNEIKKKNNSTSKAITTLKKVSLIDPRRARKRSQKKGTFGTVPTAWKVGWKRKGKRTSKP